MKRGEVISLNKPRVIQWRDIFAIVDDGRLSVDDYREVEQAVRKQAGENPGGLGCLVILPPGATPPAPIVRRHIKDMLARLPIRCLGYAVEGTGFKGAAARATLIGMELFTKKRYPLVVEKDVPTALTGVLVQLGGPQRRDDGIDAHRAIARARAA